MTWVVDLIVNLLRTEGYMTDYNSASRTSGGWIFPAYPSDESIINDANQFPRITVDEIDLSSDILGGNSTSTVDSAVLEIVCWVHEHNILTVGATTMAQNELARELGSDVISVLKTYWATNTNIRPITYDFRITGARLLPPERAGTAKFYKYSMLVHLMGIDQNQ